MTPRPHVVEVYRDAAGNYRVIAAAEQGHTFRWYCLRKARAQNQGVTVRVLDERGDL